MIKKLLLLVAILYTIALAIASLINLGGVPSLGSGFDDKIYHLLAYIIMAFLWVTYFKFSKKKYSVFISVFLFGVVLELIQHKINPNRTYDTYDLISNCIGVVVGTLIALNTNILKLK